MTICKCCGADRETYLEAMGTPCCPEGAKMEMPILSDEAIHKLTDHWNPVPTRIDGIAPEVIKLRLFLEIAKAQRDLDAINWLKWFVEFLFSQMHHTTENKAGKSSIAFHIPFWRIKELKDKLKELKDKLTELEGK